MRKEKVNADGRLRLYLMQTKLWRKKLIWKSKIIYLVKTIIAREKINAVGRIKLYTLWILK